MMVIGLLFTRLRLFPVVTALAFNLSLCAQADDQIIKKNGTTVSGTILSASDNQVMIENHTANGGVAKFPIPLSDVKSVVMAVPAEVTQVQGANVAPADVITALEPQVKKYIGLPVNWLVAAMAQLGDAYLSVGQSDKALGIYDEISKVYPGSAFENVAKAGRAKLDLKANKIDEAYAAVLPVVTEANKNIAPSPTEGPLYADAFIVYGQILEAQKKPQKALEAYLTVTTMFYQNTNLADQAGQLAKSLRDKNPNLGVE
jgi:tetratricopeptide (TPR) repeat protein